MDRLIASLGPQHEFLRGFRDQPEVGGETWLWWTALAAVLAAAAAWIVVELVRRDRLRHGATLRYLSRRLGLGAAQMRLLVRVAQAAGIPTAGSLLISRGVFDHATRHYVGRHGQANRLRAIRRTIFG